MKALEEEMFECKTKTRRRSFSQTIWRVNYLNKTKMAA